MEPINDHDREHEDVHDHHSPRSDNHPTIRLPSPEVRIQLTPQDASRQKPPSSCSDQVETHHPDANLHQDNNNKSTNVIHLRLTPHEKTQLDNEIFRWGYRGGGREEAEELSRNPTEFVEAIALGLFRRWSFAHAVKSALISAFSLVLNNSLDTVDTGTPDTPPSHSLPVSGVAGEKGLLVRRFRALLDTRSKDPLQQIPGDSRKRRVDALLADEINTAFFEALVGKTAMEEGVGSSSRREQDGYGVKEGDLVGADLHVVAPHPEDLAIWRLLAYQAWRNSTVWKAWPGVHEAAAYAGGEETEYPYFEMWERPGEDENEEENEENEASSDDYYSESLGSQVDSDDGRSGAAAETTLITNEIVARVKNMPSNTGIEVASSPPQSVDDSAWDTGSGTTSSSMRRRRNRRRDVYALFEAADVWDVWILCQMVRCQDAVWGYDQCPGTEHRFYLFEQLPLFQEAWVRREAGEKYDNCGFLQRRLSVSDDDEWVEEVAPEILKQRWPLPLPRDFIEFADYSEYRFEKIDDGDVISSLLASAGLSTRRRAHHDKDTHNPTANTTATATTTTTVPDIEWDLIYLATSKRDPLRHDSDREHLHHTIYTSDDYIQWEYDEGEDLPGLCHPCECVKLTRKELEQRKLEDEAEYARIQEEGKKWVSSEDGRRIAEGPWSPEENIWRSRQSKARLKKEMKEKYGRCREFPPEHYDYDHAGGNVVFNRRRLEDVPGFVRELDRFWVDWNDCMLIMGAGYDSGDDDSLFSIQDEETIYILETLPGIKRRWEKINKV